MRCSSLLALCSRFGAAELYSLEASAGIGFCPNLGALFDKSAKLQNNIKNTLHNQEGGYGPPKVYPRSPDDASSIVAYDDSVVIRRLKTNLEAIQTPGPVGCAEPVSNVSDSQRALRKLTPYSSKPLPNQLSMTLQPQAIHQNVLNSVEPHRKTLRGLVPVNFCGAQTRLIKTILTNLHHPVSS